LPVWPKFQGVVGFCPSHVPSHSHDSSVPDHHKPNPASLTRVLSIRHNSNMNKFLLTLALATVSFNSAVCAYTPVTPKSHRSFGSSRLPPSPSFPSSSTNAKSSTNDLKRISNWSLSNSVLVSCDTLPSFPTAHGILSPETVSRMDLVTQGGSENVAVSTFLKTYRKHGPMSCLGMLSDPNILPHLTQAMRDIAV